MTWTMSLTICISKTLSMTNCMTWTVSLLKYLFYYCAYFQKHEFKYCFGSNTILHSVKFLAAYNKKASVVPGAASGQTILASEALSDIGEAINKVIRWLLIGN